MLGQNGLVGCFFAACGGARYRPLQKRLPDATWIPLDSDMEISAGAEISISIFTTGRFLPGAGNYEKSAAAARSSMVFQTMS